MDVQLAKVLQEITNDILKGVRDIMDSDVGINQKVGINTLHNSNLYNQIKQSWKETGDNVVIDTFFNHYISYIEWDRPPKYGKMPPVFEIIKWLRRKHIVSSNKNIKSVAYVISRSIWEKGWDSQFENKYADMLFDALFKEVDDYFSD